MKKNCDIRDIQMRCATFQPEQTGDYDGELWIAWANNVFAEQHNHLHWCNLSMTCNVSMYVDMSLSVCQHHTYWWLRIKKFLQKFSSNSK
jgi:hypothetical protein